MNRNIKKALAVLLVTVMVFGSAPLVGFVGIELPKFNLFGTKADAATSGYYEYTVSDGKATITDVSTSISGSITIPTTLGGYPVTSIGYDAFYNCTGLTSITISDSVTSIGRSAFHSCTGLTSVTIPDSVTSIAGYAFYNCTGLTSVTIPDSVTSIGASAFSKCTGLISIVIPDSVTSIGADAFRGCSRLTSVTIPDSVTSIGAGVFCGCSRLTSVTIPDSVTSIGDEAFYYCTGLTSVTIPDCVTSIGYQAFYKCTGLTSITIPDSVTSIGGSAFRFCTGLTSVTIGNGVTNIGGAFYECTGLTNVYYTGDIAGWCSINFGSSPMNYAKSLYISGKKVEGDIVIPDGVTSIGSDAFSHCKGITSITIPDSVTSIGSGAFTFCTGLTSITIPDSVTSIGTGAFSYCYGLTSVKIGNSVTSIGDYAFYICEQLTSITIGNSVTSIGNYVFEECSKLKSVFYTGDIAGWCSINFGSSPMNYANNLYIRGKKVEGDLVIPDGVTSIVNNAFRNCTGLTSVTIPDSVTSIGTGAFYNTGIYNDSSNWENGVLYIGKYLIKADSTISGAYIIKTGTKVLANSAFRGCTGLTSITIPDSVTSIGKQAFSKCTGLTSITIPDSVTILGSWAFEGCENLASVTIGNSVTSIGSSAFSGCTGLKSITIGNGVTSIGSSAFYNCTRLTSVYYSGDVAGWCSLSFSDYSSSPMNYADSLYISGKKVEGDLVIPDGVTSIGAYAFYNFDGLTSVTIPDSVTSIGDSAFYYCRGLTSVTIGHSVTSIGDSAFSSCTGLTSVTIPDSVTSIGNGAFSGCGLTSITIPDSVTSIGDSAFYSCTGLSSITIPDSVTSIGRYAFERCTGLTSVTIGNGVTSIGDSAFTNTGLYNDESNWENNVLYIGSYLIEAADTISGNYKIKVGTKAIAIKAFYLCTKLTSVTIPDSVSSIGDHAFDECYRLTNITIGNGVTSIGSYSFNECYSLTSVTIPDSVTSIGDSAFYDCFGLTGIMIPKSVTSIGNSAFSECLSIFVTNYYGTMSEWNDIDLGEDNEYLTRYIVYEYGTETAYYDKGTLVSGLEWILYSSGNLVIEGSGAIPNYPESGTPWYGLREKIKNVFISEGVSDMGDSVFSGCTNIESFSVDESNPDFSNDEHGALYNKDKSILIKYPAKSEYTEYTVPDSVGTIRAKAFEKSKNLISVTMNTSIVKIGESAFKGCSNILQAFYYGTKGEWKSINVGSNNKCLTDKLIYDCGSENPYYNEGTCGNNLKWVFYTNGSLVISGTGSMNNYYTSTPAPWSNYRSRITSIKLTDGVTGIGNSAFAFCANAESIEIPSSVTSIGQLAFAECDKIKEVTIPDSVKTVGSDAFRDCNSLESVVFPDSVTSIGDSAFYMCTSLKNVTLPKNITLIDDYMFYKCSSLENVEIPSSVSRIGAYAFYKSGIKTIIIPDSVTSIDDYAFYSCSGLQEISFPVTAKIYNSSYVFRYCTNIEKITLTKGTTGIMPDYGNNTSTSSTTTYYGYTPWYISNCSEIVLQSGIKTIGQYAFYNCTNISTVQFEGTSDEFFGITINSFNDPLFDATISFNAYSTKWICGDAVEKRTFRVGDKIVPPDMECAEGYAIADWTPEIPDTMPAEDLTFTAVLKLRGYKVEWIVDDTVTEETIEYGQTISKPANPEKAGYTFVGWTPEIPETMPAKDMSFTAVFKANSYNAVFNANGGAWSDGETTKTVATDFDSEIIAPKAPAKQGYIFSKWSPEVGTMDDVNGKAFNAVWIASTDTRYTVETYTMNTEGEYVKTVQNYTGETDSTANAEYTVAKGFTLNEEKSVLSGVISADNSLVLKVYFDRNKYTFTSVVDGTATETEYLYGSIIAEPAAPVKTGYTFADWDKVIPKTMPAENFTVTARFTANSYNAVFDANGGKWSGGATTKTVATDFGSNIVAPANPTRQGYDFAGWDSEIGKMDDVNGKTFSAKWTVRNDTKYTVEIYTMDAYGKYSSSKETKYGSTDTEASITANAQTGFTVNSTKSNLSGNIAGDGSLVLRIYYDRNKYKFITNIDGNTTSKDYYYDAPVTMPANPDKPGYKFIGWDKTIPSKMPANDVTVTAVFEQILLKISIRNPSTTTIKYGDKIILHADMNEALPNGWTIKWTADNGNFSYSVSADGSTCTISPSKSGSTNFKATVYDEKGNVFCEDTQSMTSKAGFFDKIGAFFRKLFGSTKTIPQLFKGIF